MEEGNRSFAVWWRCVLTQWGDEDGILIGLIELMVLSPLVGEECQASLWLCASWLLSACCSCTLALIWTLSLCLWVLLLSSVAPHCNRSSSALLLSLSLCWTFLFYTIVQIDKCCFYLLPTYCTFVANVSCSFSYWFYEVFVIYKSLYSWCPCSGLICVCVCVCVIIEGWHLKQCI